MRFRKISETKIHCLISQEEMEEKGIEIEDFLEHRDKTEEFIREVLAEAKYELDLEDMGCYYSVQMSVLPEGDVSLVISGEGKKDVGEALSEFGKRLQDFKEIMNEAKKQLEQKKGESASKNTSENVSENSKEMEKADLQNKSGEKKPASYIERPIWVRMESLDQCIKVAKNMKNASKIDSAVYKYDGEYFMRLKFLDKEQQIAGAILVASEYAIEIFTEDQGGCLLLEHGVAVCKDHALETLASL